MRRFFDVGLPLQTMITGLGLMVYLAGKTDRFADWTPVLNSLPV